MHGELFFWKLCTTRDANYRHEAIITLGTTHQCQNRSFTLSKIFANDCEKSHFLQQAIIRSLFYTGYRYTGIRLRWENTADSGVQKFESLVIMVETTHAFYLILRLVQHLLITDANRRTDGHYRLGVGACAEIIRNHLESLTGRLFVDAHRDSGCICKPTATTFTQLRAILLWNAAH